MVELKSFKYVGDSAAGELGSKLDARKANIDASVASAKEESDAFGSPPLSTTPSSQSISTIVGGNLTATSDSGSQTLQNPASAASDKNETGKQSDEEASSNECHVAQFDIIGEEDESHEGADDAVTRINIIQREQQDQQQQQQQQPPAATPAPAQTPAMSANRRNFAKSPHAPLKSGRPRTPLMAHGVQLARAHLDNLSEDSFRPTQGANHFEIRWRNVNLRARRKSKLPNCIADHPLYKLFSKNSDLDGSQDKIYNSPPLMRHRLPQSPKLAGDAKLTSGSLSGNLAAAGDSESGSSSTDQYRTILNSISGSVFSGQLTAILGPSGVGKTTLLNSLTGRNTLDGTGRVSLLGNEASKRMSVVTVPQADVLPGKLTALEDLRFTSRLRNPERGFDHERNIGRIVRHLQMDKFLNTRIDKLSGGEARRLSIGRELLGSPDIMILDEPTSGLDANTCKKIIVALRDIVEHSDNILDKPMSIIITIHQPQQEVLNIFHRVYVMALGGCAIYEGPAPSLLPHLLEHSSLSKECQVEQLNENPAIVAIEVASGEYGLNVISELAQHHELQCMTNDDSFSFDSNGCSPFMTPRTVRGTPRRSPLAVSPRVGLTHSRSAGRISLDGASIGKPTPVLGRHAKLGSPLPALSSVTSLSSYDIDLPEPVSRLKVDKRLRRSVIMKGDFISHTLTLMSRCWLLTTRDMFLMVVRVVGFLMVAAGMVQIFAHALDPDEHICPMYQSEVDDVLSFMESTRERIQHVQKMLQQSSSTHTFFFHLGLCIFMVNAALAGLVFPLSMRMFLREYKNGWYSPASFITSNTLAELPVDMIGPILVVLIVYPLCNQPASDYHWREFGYVLVLIVSCIIGKSQSQIIGALLMNSVEMSVFISCVAVAPQAILSGIAVRVTQMTWPLQMASYTSWLRYCYEILFALRYGAGICPCDPATVNGYPTKPTLTAIPDHLDRMARGFLELNPGSVSVGAINSTSGLLIIEPDSAALQMMGPAMVDKYDTNLFVRYIRLVMDAGNLFAPKLSDLGDCTNYRSLYLIDMGIPDSVLTKWAAVLLAYLVFSRLLTYFVVKTVIKNAP